MKLDLDCTKNTKNKNMINPDSAVLVKYQLHADCYNHPKQKQPTTAYVTTTTIIVTNSYKIR